MTLITFRDSILKAVPRWLRFGIAARLLYSIAILCDATADAVVAAVRRRFPGLDGASDALGIIGRERRIRRGRNEPDTNYTPRLRQWLTSHRNRGGPFAMLGQLGAFYAQTPFTITLVYRSGRQFIRDVAGNITYSIIPWAPDALPLKWARWWLYYQWPDVVTSDGVWGDPGTWGDGGVWGSSLTPQDVADLRLIPQEWNAGHTFGRVVLLVGSETWGVPVGTWGDPGVWGAGTTVDLSIE